MNQRDVVQPTAEPGAASPVTQDLAFLREAIVNVYLAGHPGAGDRGWVLIDAGLAGSARHIAHAAALRFGEGARPSAIVLTHGHFDHIGAVRTLAEQWDAPIYAHEMEMPYLTGRSSYPPPDPTVGGGAMALLAWAYPKGPIDLGERVHTLPADGAVPGMPGWRWIHTPGHAPGHVSLFRTTDRTLIAGDAFVTTKQESAIAVATQRPEIHGPPMYFTPDWEAAADSVRRLAALEPEVAATGHGRPMRGPALRSGLLALVRNFEEIAVPAHGRYVGHPAIADSHGVVSVPPAMSDHTRKVALGIGAAVAVGVALGAFHRVRRGDELEAGRDLF